MSMWSVLWVRLSGGTVEVGGGCEEDCGVDGVGVDLGDAVAPFLDAPFGVAEPPFCLLMSFRHFETIILASWAISGDLWTLSLLMVLPICVCRRRSSVGLTPFWRSFIKLTMLGVGSCSLTAFWMALLFDMISRESMMDEE